jgi:hypothetical protein
MSTPSLQTTEEVVHVAQALTEDLEDRHCLQKGRLLQPPVGHRMPIVVGTSWLILRLRPSSSQHMGQDTWSACHPLPARGAPVSRKVGIQALYEWLSPGHLLHMVEARAGLLCELLSPG